jgi:hypothetical protein
MAKVMMDILEYRIARLAISRFFVGITIVAFESISGCLSILLYESRRTFTTSRLLFGPHLERETSIVDRLYTYIRVLQDLVAKNARLAGTCQRKRLLVLRSAHGVTRRKPSEPNLKKRDIQSHNRLSQEGIGS